MILLYARLSALSTDFLSICAKISVHPALASRRAFPAGDIARDVFPIDFAQFLLAVDIRLIHFGHARRATVAGGLDAPDGFGNDLLPFLAGGILDQVDFHFCVPS